MRLILAMMRHETNTFSPIPTPLRAFGPKSGEQAISIYRGTNNPLAAYIDIAEREGAEYVVPLVANASPSAAVDQDAFDEMADAICDAVRKSCDGVMLDLHGAMKGEINPVILWHSLPMLTHMLCQTPLEQPMKDIMNRAKAAEASGDVLNASIFGGFPLADIPHVGLSGVVVVDGDATVAGRLLDELMAMAWERREGFVFDIEPVEISLERAKELDNGPTILVDHGDNCGAGGPQDNMEVLEKVLQLGLEDVAAGPFCDLDSVAKMLDAGIGTEVTVQLGGKTNSPAIGLSGRPITVSGTVRCITDGRFVVKGPMVTGSPMNLGRTAVLRSGYVDIVVSERRHEPFDTGCFTHAGIDPAAKQYILIKSRQQFRAGQGS